MIDGLLVKDYIWLFIFLFCCVMQNIFMFRRMVFDTKVYTSIYNKMVLSYLKTDTISDTSTRIARTDISNNIINFLENDLQYYLMSIMSVIGTFFFIILEDVYTGLIASTCVIPVLIVIKLLYKKIEKSTKVSHDHYEQKVDIMTRGSEEEIETFYKRRKKVLTYSSTLQGKNWFALNTIKSFFLVICLVMFTYNNLDLTQGEAVSMYSYINQFLISILSIPIGAETFSRMRDVLNRIN